MVKEAGNKAFILLVKVMHDVAMVATAHFCSFLTVAEARLP